jgi:hypothetical protein
MHRSVGVGAHALGCRFLPSAVADAESVLQRIDDGEPMAAAELLDAYEVLGRLVPSRRQDVLVARVRIAVRLERLGV